jgi:small-conductance mechanosensitive channel
MLYITDLLERFAAISGLDPHYVIQFANSVLVVFLLWAIRFVTLRVVARHTEDVRIRYSWRKGSTYVAVTLGILLIGRMWFAGFEAVSTYLGLVSAGIAIALKDPLANLAGWAFIMWRRPFTVGDRVEIGSNRGDVIDLRIFQFTLMEIGNWVDADQSTGRVIRIPNGKVFTETLANYSKGFRYIWHEIPVLITFESNWRKAKTTLTEIANRHGAEISESAVRKVREASEDVMIFYQKLTPVVYTTVKDCGVLLTIRCLCEPRKRRGVEESLWEDILEAFAQFDDIDFAYPTQRFFDHRIEGKRPQPVTTVSGTTV